MRRHSFLSHELFLFVGEVHGASVDQHIDQFAFAVS